MDAPLDRGTCESGRPGKITVLLEIIMKKRTTAILFAALGSLTLCAATMPLEDFSDLSAWKSDSYTPNTKFEKTAKYAVFLLFLTDFGENKGVVA